MPLIETIKPDQASGDIAKIYTEVQELFGFVPNAIQLDSINPKQMFRHWESVKEVLQYQGLSQKLFTMIRMFASIQEKCDYCIDMNAGMLVEMEGMSLEEVEQSKLDPSNVNLDKKEKALLLFVIKVLKDSNSTSQEDLHALRDLGASDKEIYDVVTHGAQIKAGDIILNAFKVDKDMP